jgi:predicted nucleic acid-binding protein
VEVAGWILDKSASARIDQQEVAEALDALAGSLYLCPVGELEQLYSARSARDFDRKKSELRAELGILAAPADIFERALALQRDLAHHRGMWHRTPIPDLLIAETALHHAMGVVHVDGDFERIAEIRPLETRRISD